MYAQHEGSAYSGPDVDVDNPNPCREPWDLLDIRTGRNINQKIILVARLRDENYIQDIKILRNIQTNRPQDKAYK